MGSTRRLAGLQVRKGSAALRMGGKRWQCLRSAAGLQAAPLARCAATLSSFAPRLPGLTALRVLLMVPGAPRHPQARCHPGRLQCSAVRSLASAVQGVVRVWAGCCRGESGALRHNVGPMALQRTLQLRKQLWIQ